MTTHTLVQQLVNDPVVHPTGHVAATGLIILSWVGILGPLLSVLATLMAILWYSVTLYESKTVQDIITHRKAQKIVGPKLAAQANAADKVIVAADALTKADALPEPPPDRMI